jgi:Cys/Met metabolism PLP-dependent enzyme
MWAGTVDEGALTEAGVSQGLIRVAAGLEDTDDLVADVPQRARQKRRRDLRSHGTTVISRCDARRLDGDAAITTEHDRYMLARARVHFDLEHRLHELRQVRAVS